MNKLKEELEQQKIKVIWNSVCEQIKKDTIEQILNLECLKEEEPDEFDDFIGTDRIETKNKLRKEIKEEIKKL